MAGYRPERRVGMHRADMQPGDRFVNVTAGGGGWGDPLTRLAERVLDDVREGYVSRDQARATYGIDIRPDGSWQPTPVRHQSEKGS